MFKRFKDEGRCAFGIDKAFAVFVERAEAFSGESL
jgi:hypothetical protein